MNKILRLYGDAMGNIAAEPQSGSPYPATPPMPSHHGNRSGQSRGGVREKG